MNELELESRKFYNIYTEIKGKVAEAEGNISELLGTAKWVEFHGRRIVKYASIGVYIVGSLTVINILSRLFFRTFVVISFRFIKRKPRAALQ
jgi:hypothetical protein